MASIEELTAKALALPLDDRVVLLDTIFDRLDAAHRAPWNPEDIEWIRRWAREVKSNQVKRSEVSG